MPAPGKIEVRTPGSRGAEATVVLVFPDDVVVEVMDVTFQPPGDVERGAGLLADLAEAGNALMNLHDSGLGGLK